MSWQFKSSDVVLAEAKAVHKDNLAGTYAYAFGAVSVHYNAALREIERLRAGKPVKPAKRNPRDQDSDD